MSHGQDTQIRRLTRVATIFEGQGLSQRRVIRLIQLLLGNQLLEDGRREDGQHLFQTLALALVQHRLADEYIATQDAILLGLFEAPKEGSPEV